MCTVSVRKIVEKIERHPFITLFDRINRGEKNLHVSGLHGSVKSFLLSLISRRINRTLIVITPTEKEAKDLYQDVSFFLGEENKVTLYPQWDFSATDILAFQRDVELSRIEVLSRLLIEKLPVVIVPMKALMQKVIPREVLEDYLEVISIGDTVDRDGLVLKLSAGGYHRVILVDEKGQFSLRGHVIDIYPPTALRPVRMEFIGDELESIREFDPASQRSTGELIDFTLAPTRDVILSEDRRKQAIVNIKYRALELELPRITRTRLTEVIENDLISSINPLFLPLFYESFEREEREISSESPAEAGKEDFQPALGTFFDYMPEDCILIFDDFPAIERARENIENETDRFLLKARNEEKFYLEKDSCYSAREPILQKCNDFRKVYLEGLPIGTEGHDDNNTAVFHVNAQMNTDVKPTIPSQKLGEGDGFLNPLAEKIKLWLHEGNLVIFLGTGQEEVERLGHLLEQYNIPAARSNVPFAVDVDQYSDKGRLVIREGKITGGFRLPDLKLIVITEEEVFGRKVSRRRPRPGREGFFLKSFGDLNEGDYAVHTDHGIGVYRGLKKLSIGEIETDFLLLEYLEGDKLYIPIDRLDQIQRYIGPEGFAPRIEKLGGSSW